MMRKWRYRIGRLVLPGVMRLLSATWKIEEEGREEVESVLSGEEPAVIAFLHGRMFPVWYRFRGGRFGAVVSGSRDGELLTRYLKKGLKYISVLRGSSSRGGSEVLEEMVRLLAHTSCLITPDGPRGPAGEPKVGALLAARRSGRRVVVVTWKAERSRRFKTWDRMEIPRPFSRIKFRYCTIKNHPQKGQIKQEELVELQKLLAQ